MKHRWLSRNSGRKLIVFFDGWGMDDCPLRGLQTDGYSVVVLFDYSDLDFPLCSADWQPYREITLVGWSMGVWALARFRHCFPEHCSTLALNGTPFPIHDQYGIPSATYRLTCENLTEEGLSRFFRKMCATADEHQALLQMRPERDFENQRLELQRLEQHVLSYSFPQPPVFSGVIIADNDRIIPTKNQLQYWANHPRKKVIASGHYCFGRWQSFDELLGEAPA